MNEKQKSVTDGTQTGKHFKKWALMWIVDVWT